MASRTACLSDPTHRVVCPSPPQHSSWLNQIALWLSLRVRQLLHRGSVTAVVDLEAQVLAFIASSTRTLARPFQGTYQGKALAA